MAPLKLILTDCNKIGNLNEKDCREYVAAGQRPDTKFWVEMQHNSYARVISQRLSNEFNRSQDLSTALAESEPIVSVQKIADDIQLGKLAPHSRVTIIHRAEMGGMKGDITRTGGHDNKRYPRRYVAVCASLYDVVKNGHPFPENVFPWPASREVEAGRLTSFRVHKDWTGQPLFDGQSHNKPQAELLRAMHGVFMKCSSYKPRSIYPHGVPH